MENKIYHFNYRVLSLDVGKLFIKFLNGLRKTSAYEKNTFKVEFKLLSSSPGAIGWTEPLPQIWKPSPVTNQRKQLEAFEAHLQTAMKGDKGGCLDLVISHVKRSHVAGFLGIPPTCLINNKSMADGSFHHLIFVRFLLQSGIQCSLIVHYSEMSTAAIPTWLNGVSFSSLGCKRPGMGKVYTVPFLPQVKRDTCYCISILLIFKIA